MPPEALDTRAQWLRRLRWRLRGAWLWPTFFAITLVDAALLHWLPIAGDGPHWVGALLLAGCLNIVVVAAFGQAGGWLLRRRRRDLPKVVADDYAGTCLLLAVSATFLALGLAHRPEIEDQRDDFVAQSTAVRRYVAASAPAEYQRRIEGADSVQVDEDLYRTCVPGEDPERWLCLFVNTSGEPATVRLDRNRESNASFDRAGAYR